MSNAKTFIVCIIVLWCINSYAQTPITVAESTLKVSSFGDEVFYYGFAKGDQLVFNFEEINGKDLKEVEITEFPTSSKFMDYQSKKIENKVVNIAQTGIYKFRFSNSSIAKRICKFKIQRIPANETTINFNTSIYWEKKNDTTYTTFPEKYLIKKDTTFQNFYGSEIPIHAGQSEVVEFVVPENTLSWAFYIGTNKHAQEALNKAQDNFLKNSAAICCKLPGYGPLAAIALTGISCFNQMQGGSNVRYWFLSNYDNVSLFKSHNTFMQYKQGNVITEATQMKFPLSGKVYLALSNDNIINPITVTIRTTAFIVKEQWGIRDAKQMKITSVDIPYLKD